jgi:hypothetical protein
MIRFTVVWSEPANDRLAILWMNAPDRNAVTAAANTIDAALASDPLRNGSHCTKACALYMFHRFTFSLPSKNRTDWSESSLCVPIRRLLEPK